MTVELTIVSQLKISSRFVRNYNTAQEGKAGRCSKCAVGPGDGDGVDRESS